MDKSLYKFDINNSVQISSIYREILQVDSIPEQVLCIYVQSFRIDFTVRAKTN